MKQTIVSHIITAVLTAIIAGTVGYYLHAFRSSSPFIANKNDIPSLDFLLVENSFSEVKNAKAFLEATAKQLIMGMWNQTRLDYNSGIKTKLETDKANPPTKIKSAIRCLEEGIQEYGGTEEKLLIVKNLLVLLWENDMRDRWLDLYLKTLNEDSIHPLIMLWADRAWDIGRNLGREDQVAATLQRFQGGASLAENRHWPMNAWPRGKERSVSDNFHRERLNFYPKNGIHALP